MLPQTPSQTVGPYLSLGLDRWTDQNVLATDQTRGDRITITGRVLDGEGAPVRDALVEIWQANAAGRYAHDGDTQDKPLDPAFKGFGRCATDDGGRFRFVTVKPGRVPGRGNTLQAPHAGVIVTARGMLDHAFTRLYFDDEAEANAEDPLLGMIEAARRGTLVAKAATLPGGERTYRFDIHLQGEQETVFLEP
jgi:protocatechuate 3,4-dioxygenase alpha subunit